VKSFVERYAVTAKTINHENLEKEKQLLSSEERAVLSQIATKEPPHSRRAQALLAIDEGTTQTEAGRQAGLTHGQVRYWLIKFRESGMSAFPEELLNQARQDAGVDEVRPDLPEAEQTAEPVDEAVGLQEDAPKAKKKGKKKAKKKGKKEPKKKPKKKAKRKSKKGKKPAKKTKKKGKK
jgi:transposase-like protein